MSRPANVATGKCRERQISRPANVATGKCRDRQKSRPAEFQSANLSRSANVAIGKCRDRQICRDRQKSDLFRGVDRHLVDHRHLRCVGSLASWTLISSTFADKDSAWGICFLNRESACLLYICFTKVFSKVRTCFESLKKMEFSNQFSAVVKNLVF